MAVVQISKIQQRRGQKLLTGMPQLSSAELAWAVDTQELYIGNGSVAEGAPYVGNTRLLTEHDNILALAGTYRFAEPDLAITASIDRSFQSKLDEIQVSVIDFGPAPDPAIDHAEYFEVAFGELFQNSDETYRKVLVVPNGHYYFNSILRIPSNVILRGETQEGVILDLNGNGIEFLSAANTDSLNFTSTDHPENVRISNLTIYYDGGTTNLTGLQDSYFENVKWTSDYTLGDVVSTPVLASQSYDISAVADEGNVTISGSGLAGGVPLITVFTSGVVATVDAIVTALNLDTTFDNNFVASRSAESLIITAIDGSDISAIAIETYFTVRVQPTGAPTNFEVTPTPTQASSGINNVVAAVSWTNTIFGTRTNNINFVGCTFESTALAVKCIHDHGQSDVFETEIKFKDTTFFVCDTGTYIEGVTDRQTNAWNYDACRFEEIAKQAVFATMGVGTLIHNSEFKNVGNGVNGAQYPVTPMVEFGTMNGNVVEACKSDRHQAAGITLLNTTVGIPEVLNGGNVRFINDYYADIYKSDTAYPLAVFSSFHRYIIIDYVLTIGEYQQVRTGRLVITNQPTAETTAEHVAIADNFTYVPSRIADIGGNMITTFEFSVELKDNDDTTGDSSQSVDTILLSYTNPLSYNATGTISYSVSYGV
jgi:hypothetical protein